MKDFYYLVSSTESLEKNDVGFLKNKISEKKLIKASGENTFLSNFFPNLFAEIAIYKLEKKS